MIITCPKCETKYRYDERRFDGDESKQVKCTSCGLTFEAANPSVKAAEPKAPDGDDIGEMFELADDSGDDWGSEPAKDPASPPSPVDAPIPAMDGIDEDSPLPPLPTDPRYSLAVIAGGQAGTVFQIHKPRIFLGRGSSMNIQLRDSEVSRRHAMVEINGDDVTLVDLDTTNGTWFNGVRIQRTALEHQDEFTLGSTTLMIIVTPVRDGR